MVNDYKLAQNRKEDDTERVDREKFIKAFECFQIPNLHVSSKKSLCFFTFFDFFVNIL